ncbi:hypothetical protein CLOP_g17441 [Closterium sp. NIES-67]|nr:hypothetical protein CLOP_g17441 [Closterium sp. NIES-67]
MEGTCWYCKKIGHPWFKCFSRLEGWAPPGMKPPSGERAQGGAVQGSGEKGEVGGFWKMGCALGDCKGSQGVAAMGPDHPEADSVKRCEEWRDALELLY